MRTLSKRHFWEWFKNCHQQYLSLEKQPRKEFAYWVNELNAHLRAYGKFLGFTLVVEHNRYANLTITVNGKANHFKKVDAFVALAPEIPGWEISALQQPMPAGFLLEDQREATGADPDELSFSFDDNNPASGDIMVYHPLCTEENEPVFRELARGAVYNLLGERCYGTAIRSVEVANRSLADPDTLLRDIQELPELFHDANSTMIVDDKGNLIHHHSL